MSPPALSVRVSGTGFPMLLHNGLLSSDLHWRFWVPHFSEALSVITWDYPGHGLSAPPESLAEIGIGPFAESGHRVLARAVGQKRAIVCGLSMGVQVALEHYRRYPADVAALVLLCGTFGHPLARVSAAPWFRKGIVRLLDRATAHPRLIRTLRTPFVRTRLGHELAYLFGGAHRESCPKAVLDELFDHVRRVSPDVLTTSVSSYVQHTAEDVLSQVSVPTLIVAGSKDNLTPASIAEYMHRQIPGSELCIIDGHTHLSQVEAPERVHAVVSSFLSTRGLWPKPN